MCPHAIVIVMSWFSEHPSSPKHHWLSIFVLGLFFFGCSRYGFPSIDANQASHDARSDDARSGDLQRDQGSLDVPRDQPQTSEEQRLDAPSDCLSCDVSSLDTHLPDLSISPTLPCKTPQLVGSGSTPSDINGAALHTDGLTLVAQTYTSGTYQTCRSAWGQPFGAWSHHPIYPSGDTTFFAFNSKETAIIATQGTTIRHLRLCTEPSWQCSNIVLLNASTGQAITVDADGPEVITLPNGNLLMAHNLGPQGKHSADIYLAHPTKPGDLSTWTTTPVGVAANTPSISEDDPALSPDGLVILFSAQGPGGDDDIWITRRATPSSPFPRPVLLSDVNSSDREGGTSLAPVPGQTGTYELFFESTRSTGDKGSSVMHIYRTICGP